MTYEQTPVCRGCGEELNTMHSECSFAKPPWATPVKIEFCVPRSEFQSFLNQPISTTPKKGIQTTAERRKVS